jgi:hypothetical protein
MVSVAMVCIAGCSSGSAPAPAPTPPEKTVFDPLTQQVDRAREVQKTVDESAERARNAVAAEERGDTAAPADASPHADTRP